jgi:hypothetical protein
MRPRKAEAATVHGEAKYTCTLDGPMRPLKLRAVLEITVVFSAKVAP